MLPKLIKIRQNMPAPQLADVASEVRKQLAALSQDPETMRGKRIGITAGSRGIRNIPLILNEVARFVKEAGGSPVIVAAMGSHGGATAEGQKEMLDSLGITEASTGAPVLCHEEAARIGETESGIPVFCNEEAIKLDGLAIVNRIKSHTDFSGEIESGLCKMMTIGLGNNQGAGTAHYYAVNNGYTEMICDSAEVFMKKLPILFGLGIVENWKNQTMRIEAVYPKDLIAKEKELLRYYKENSLKLPFTQADVLVVEELGKNISGAGMDTKVIGRIRILGQKEPDYPKITNVAVLNLTEESHGNATGIGLADYSTLRVFEALDLKATTINGLTSMSPDQIRIPVILDTDREAIEAACTTLGPAKENNIAMAVIRNTALLEEMAVTENILEQIRDKVEVLGAAEELRFGADGRLVSMFE
ncbi:MAG: lactate racemase domain-containing protein [Clostridiales Family XIII bacterium]|jgi:hypothetical protein|nr:lactate racemase domain-containing protein [Clostridiales Family XIII bacterium]